MLCEDERKVEVMRPSEVLENNREFIRQLTVKCNAANPRVFGSLLHGTDTEESDLDILVDTLPGTTSFFDLGGLQYELEETLGVHVDLLTPNALPKKFRDKVIAEAAVI